ncbi:MAG: geranylgeranyl reductase family protein [Nitrososphaerales archaeon]
MEYISSLLEEELQIYVGVGTTNGVEEDNMESYDVLVVGAGPAGVSAAKSAARSGAKTLLIEKQPMIMASKPCGEATSQKTLKTAGVDPKPSIVMHRADAMVFAPNLKYVHIDQVGFSINKTLFLQEIAAQAAEAGAHIRVREEVQKIRRSSDTSMVVKTSHGEYKAEVVIGADGYNSTVARNLGVDEKSEPIPTVQYTMVNCNLEYPDSVRFYLGNEIAPKGYAWIFPKGERFTEVGVGVRGAPAKQYLDRFVKLFENELGRGQIIDYRGAPVPIGGIIGQNILDGAILVGDAAGTVIPLTGAGIHSSVAAGLLAGEIAASASSEGDCSKTRLEEFNRRYDEEWGRRIRRSLKAMQAIEKLNDSELNILQEVLKADDILDLANGIELKRVAKKLLTHPIFAVKLARWLL